MPRQLRDTIKILLPSLPTPNPKTSTILKFRPAFPASHHPISTSAPTPRLPIDALHLVQTVHTSPNYPSMFGIIREDRGIGGEPRYLVFPSRNAQRTKMTSTPTLRKWIILKRGGSGDGSLLLFPLHNMHENQEGSSASLFPKTIRPTKFPLRISRAGGEILELHYSYQNRYYIYPSFFDGPTTNLCVDLCPSYRTSSRGRSKLDLLARKRDIVAITVGVEPARVPRCFPNICPSHNI